MSIVIVDYGSGNLHSAQKAFERAAQEQRTSTQVVVTADPDRIRTADRIVLPGVGAFGDCKRGLEATSGVLEALDEAVRAKGRPFLGICVGMQLLASRSHEHGLHFGLGWIKGDVIPIAPGDPTLKIPHMGWNTLDLKRAHPLLDSVATGASGLHAYFVHSYHFVPSDTADIVAITDYGGPVVAIVAHGNICGTQFHPEKSQRLGLALIANFLRWAP